jgi:hypothetical protein
VPVPPNKVPPPPAKKVAPQPPPQKSVTAVKSTKQPTQEEFNKAIEEIHDFSKDEIILVRSIITINRSTQCNFEKCRKLKSKSKKCGGFCDIHAEEHLNLYKRRKNLWESLRINSPEQLLPFIKSAKEKMLREKKGAPRNN